jgi:hypothetical protein
MMVWVHGKKKGWVFMAYSTGICVDVFETFTLHTNTPPVW